MKPLPQDNTLEESLLGAMIHNDDIITKLTITWDDFYNSHNIIIFSSIIECYKENNKVDLVLLSEIMKKNKTLQKIWWATKIIEIIEWYSIHWDIVERKIIDLSKKRKIIEYGRKIEQFWFNETDETNEILEKVNNISKYIFDVREKKELWNCMDFINDFYDFRRKVVWRWWLLWIPSPYKELDKYHHWMIEWKIYTIVAYSNVWKSKFAYTYVNDMIKKWKKVLFFSLEVDKWMVFWNLLCNYYWKTYKEVLDNKFDPDYMFENLEIIDDIYQLNDIVNIVKVKQPDFVVIDFIQNIQCQWWSEYEKMTLVAQTLQQLAIQTKITIMNLSQANNESRFKDWENIQPKWSWAIFASSDIIIWLYRDQWNLKLTLIKNKYWKTNINFWVSVDFSRWQFTLFDDNQTEIWY